MNKYTKDTELNDMLNNVAEIYDLRQKTAHAQKKPQTNELLTNNNKQK